MDFFKKTIKKLIEILKNHPKISAAFFGAMGAFGMAPVHFTPLLIGALCILFILHDNAKSRFEAFWIGFTFGYFYFLIGCHWIMHAVLVVNMNFLVLPTLFGIPIILALYYGFACLLSWQKGHNTTARALSFTISLGLMEILRGLLFTGFPWNLPGYTWGLEVLQSTAFIGINGLTVLTILGASVLATKSYRSIFVVWTIIGCIFVAGHYRLKNYNFDKTDINLRIVQPCIDQTIKWDEDYLFKTLSDLKNLSSIKSTKQLSAIIWPESSIASLYNDEIKNFIKEIIPQNGLLLAGAPRFVNQRNSKSGFHTSLLAIDSKGEIQNIYDKRHLVPFGEYVPFKEVLPIKKITHGLIDYVAGKKQPFMKTQNLPPFLPLICYEVIFPELVAPNLRKPLIDKPQWIVNITNDAWFGESWGPYQHLHMARVRSIETGLPLIRVANNGISAVITPTGQIQHRLEINEKGIIDFKLPKVIHKNYYASINYYFSFVFILFLFIIYKVYHQCSFQLKRNKINGSR